DGLVAHEAIARGHKVALSDVPQGATVQKLGTSIGHATRLIRAGEHVHTHNLGFAQADHHREPSIRIASDTTRSNEEISFDGYLRADGRVGTRNYLAVMATVNCSATVVRAIAETFAKRFPPNKDFDGVIALSHDHGCSVRTNGPGMATLRR